MTAAHCVTDKKFNQETFIVIAGVLDMRFAGAEKRNIKDIIVHPDRKDPTVYYDVALIILDKVNIQFNRLLKDKQQILFRLLNSLLESAASVCRVLVRCSLLPPWMVLVLLFKVGEPTRMASLALL